MRVPLVSVHEVQSFAAVALEQLIDILPFGGCGLLCILGSQPSRANEILILAGTGRYAEAAGLDLKAILDNEERAITRRRAASTQPAQSGSVSIERAEGPTYRIMLTYRTANRGRAMERRVGRQAVLRTFVGALALIGVAATSALGQGLPRAEKPEDVGLSSVRLARLTDRIETGVQKGELPGAVIVLARRGRVAYFETFGLRDPETRAPMTSDAIFRIASMTKPFTSLARPEAKVAPETEAAPAPASMAGTPEVNAN
jgi:Beta-lactamase/Domain of unknown function (DUF3369)